MIYADRFSEYDKQQAAELTQNRYQLTLVMREKNKLAIMLSWPQTRPSKPIAESCQGVPTPTTGETNQNCNNEGWKPENVPCL